MPTLTASAPASNRARAASAVAILPPTTSILGKLVLTQRTRSITPAECPCAVSTTITSTPAATSFSTRSSVPSPTPTAAPTRNWPWLSLHAAGCSVFLTMSFTVANPRNSNASLTINTRSRRCLCISVCASARVAPSFIVTKRSCGVMIELIKASRRSSKRRSRLVTMPTTLPCFTTGRPEIPC